MKGVGRSMSGGDFAARRVVLAVVIVLSGLAPGAGAADIVWPSKRALYAQRPERTKIASELLRARELLDRRVSRADMQSALPGLRFQADTVELDARLWRLTPDVLARIRALGFEVRQASVGSAQVALDGPLDALEQLAALPEVSTIHPRYAPRRRTGSVEDEADATTGALAARAAFGVDGSGVDVGILSDSFNDFIGGTISGSGCDRVLTGSSSQRSGDLPATVTVIDSEPGGGTDEGAAMAELVHDLAPGAGISFRAAVIDESDFADGIDQLRACGAGVIVDDTIFVAEPMFQDGFVAQAAARALATGIPVFSAAGNESTFGIEQTFVDPDPASDDGDYPTGADFNDFGAGNKFAAITIPAGCGIEVVLQWNEPFSGTLGPGASTDLDLYLYSGTSAASATSQLLAYSADSQGCSMPGGGSGGDPLEVLQYLNSYPEAHTVYLAIDHSCGSGSPLFRVATFPVHCSFPGGYVLDASIFHGPELYGHAAADGVVAVGAVDYRELDSGGTFEGAPGQIDVEPFSTLGGDLPFFFDASGAPLPDAPAYRFKPEIAAPDGTSTTFFGSRIGNPHPNFFGTSAAVAHAAAVAALIRQREPLLSPADLRDVLMASARDIGVAGVDPLAGAGAVDAEAAVASAIVPTATTTPTPPPSSTTTPIPLAGDCDGDGHVSIADLIRGVRIALGDAPLADCPSFDQNRDGQVTIDEIVQAVDVALGLA
ncbi:MAG: S8 family serine peptidase [Mycobacteriales bacterium]